MMMEMFNLSSSYSFLLLGIYVLCMIVLAVLWFQSGIDKIIDHKGNLEWLTIHFEKSFLRDAVPLLLIIITILEIGCGLLCLVGIVEVVFVRSFKVPLWACAMSLLTLTVLFSGQRIAKDYAGAASLMGYFIFIILLFLLTFYVSMFVELANISKTYKNYLR